MARVWMCPNCETLKPMSQAYCGACGAPQSIDSGNVSITEMAHLTADAELYKRHRPRKGRR